MGARAAKDALYEAFAEVGRALASGRRVEIADVLAQGERTVEELAGEIGQSVANTSHHLRTLARAGLVTSRREGTRVWYRLASGEVEQLWTILRAVAAAHVVGFDRLAADYVGDRADLEPVTRAELWRRLQAGDVVVIDVRPPAEYRAGHIPGAVSAPLPDLQQVLATLPADREVVAYCRGPYCVYADEAVRLLGRRGLQARRLEDGFPEWRRAGLPVAVGDT